jgi:hypothetical protein
MQFIQQWTDYVYVIHGKEPQLYKEAIASLDAPKWVQAMDNEYHLLISDGTFNLVDLPSSHKAIRTKWTYRLKRNADHHIAQFKARLVALGYSQVLGVDFDKTFAPVAKIQSI